MKILLVNLPWIKNGIWGVRAGSRWPHIKDPYTEGNYLPYPFFLGYAASLLKREGFEVKLLDCIAESIEAEEFLSLLQEYSPDLILAEISTVSLKNDLEILRCIKDTPVAVAGPDISIQESGFFQDNPFISYALIGEYEYTLLELSQCLEKNELPRRVKGLIYRDKSGIRKNPPRPLIKDLDELPWPLREGLPMDKYIDAPGGMPLPCAQIWSSRGCPFRCAFCLWPQVMYGGTRFRYRNPVNVVDEIEYLITKRNFRSIYIDDDTTNVGKRRMIQLAEEIIRRRLKFPWAIMARPDLMDEEVLLKLKEAGLFAVKYGVESAEQELLNRVNKRMNLERAIQMIRYTKTLGIKTHLTFTFGLPGETEDTIERTIELAISLDPDSVQFSIMTPFPGTELYHWYKDRNLIVSEDFSEYDGNYKAVIKGENLSSFQLENARKRAYRLWREHRNRRREAHFFIQGRHFLLLKEYLKRYGPKYTLLKGVRFLRYLRRRYSESIQFRRASIVKPPLTVRVENSRLSIYYNQNELTKNIGLNTSFRIKDRWFNSSQAVWKLRGVGSALYISLEWMNLPFTQLWKLSLDEKTLSWDIELKTLRKLKLDEMKVGMLISDRYRKWFTTEEVCQFPKLKMWQWLEVKQPPEKWVGVKCAGEGLEYLPQFIFDFDGNGKNWKVEIHNTGKEVNASAINAHYPTEKVFPYGRHKLFQGKIEFESTRTPRLPEKRSVVKLFAHSVKKEGLNRAIKRSINHLRPNFMREYFGDVMGVFDGYYAFKGPGFVQIDVTNRCNNNCIGCWCNSPLLGSRRMNEDTKKFTLPLSLVKELIDELASTGTKEIYYSGGGEPFMHPDMFSILEYTKRRNLICHINTNFTLLDKKNVERLINIPVDYITVSLWAGTPSTYTKIHPNKDEETFHEILRCLKVLNSKKAHLPFVKLYQVICNLNYTEIPQMIELAKETHSESVEFTMIDTVPGATDVLLLSKNEQRQLLRICQEVLNRRQEEGWMKDVVLFKFDNFLNRIRDSKDVTEGFYDRWIIGKIPCYIGWCSSRILANGDVNGCLKAHRIPVGNIYKKHFNEIWNSPQMLDFRHRTLTFDKNDPFFSLIGNDPNSKVGCYKSCDDIGRNVIMHERIKSLSVLEKCYLKILSRKERKRYRGKEEEKPRQKRYESLLIKGIKNGREAFTGPEHVVIDLTNRCNLRCIACWVYSPLLDKNRPKREYFTYQLSYPVVDRLIGELKELGTKIIRLTGGGEPLLYPQIESVMGRIKNEGMRLALTTNFLPLDREIIRKIIDVGVDELAVSLWAAKPSTYVKLHPGRKEEDFEHIRENLLYLKAIKGEKKPYLTIANVIMKENFDEIEDMLEFAKVVGSESIYFTLVDTISPDTESLLLSPEQREIVFEKMRKVKNNNTEINIQNLDGFLRRLTSLTANRGDYDRNLVNEIPCYIGWYFARILADGRVSPCCRGVNKTMGNINGESFRQIWLSEKYSEFRCKAKYLPKNDPYFREIGCIKLCDNLMHNQDIHRKVMDADSGRFSPTEVTASVEKRKV